MQYINSGSTAPRSMAACSSSVAQRKYHPDDELREQFYMVPAPINASGYVSQKGKSYKLPDTPRPGEEQSIAHSPESIFGYFMVGAYAFQASQVGLTWSRCIAVGIWLLSSRNCTLRP